MLGNGRLSLAGNKVAQVLVLIHYDHKRNRRRVYVYIHQKHGKMYTFFEKRRFYKSQQCNAYLNTLGAGALIIEVQDTND